MIVVKDICTDTGKNTPQHVKACKMLSVGLDMIYCYEGKIYPDQKIFFVARKSINPKQKSKEIIWWKEGSEFPKFNSLVRDSDNSGRIFN